MAVLMWRHNIASLQAVHNILHSSLFTLHSSFFTLHLNPSSMNKKDWIQYGSAIAMITSGIVLAFLSFFRNDGDISEGVLWYVAQALTYAGGVFGVSIYFKTKLGDFESRAEEQIKEYIQQHYEQPAH